MVTLQILVLSFQVRILVAQQKPKRKALVFFVLYHSYLGVAMKSKTKDEPRKGFVFCFTTTFYSIHKSVPYRRATLRSAYCL